MKRVWMVAFCLGLLTPLARAGEVKPGEPNVLVLVDAQRGALLRWALPATPLYGFQIERSVDRGPAQILGLVKPASSALSTANAEIVEAYRQAVANPGRMATAEGKQAFTRIRLAVDLLSLADPAFAAALGITYEDRNVRAGSTVVYTVRSLTSSGQPGAVYGVSPPTRIAPNPPPPPPPGLTGEASRTGVALTWGEPPEDRDPAAPVSYEIKRIDGGRPTVLTPSPLLHITSGKNEGPGFVDAKPPVETTVRYTVNSVDIFGRRGADSDPISVFVPDFTALDGPESIRTVSSGPNSVTVSWKAPENRNRKGWKILRAQRPEAGGDPLTPQPLAGSSFVDKNGVVGATYYYRITAVNQRNEEGLPRISQAVIFRGAPPAPPSALSAMLKTGRIILKWTGASTGSGYQVERSIAGKEWVILNSVVTGEPQYEDIYPSDAQGTFRYRVVSWSKDDLHSPPSSILEVRLPDTAPPLRPIINSVSGEGGKVTIRFSPTGGAGDASGFYILKSLTPKEMGEIMNAAPLDATAEAFVDPDVESGVTYIYRVYAVDRAGNRSDPSDPAGVLVGEPPLPAPPAPRARFEAKPFPRVIFEFPASANPSVRYALERQDAKGVWMLIQGPFPQATSSVMDAAPPHHAKVSYRLFTVASSGSAGPRSPVVQVDVP